MKLSLIIVVYKSESVIFNCLDSIEKYNDLGNDLEVIIVDNEQESILGPNLRTDNYSFCIKYLKSECNKGFGGGNNLGASVATSNVLFFLNPDTILVERIFSEVYQQIENNKKLIYGFSLIDKEGKKNNSYSFFYDSYVKYRFLSLLKRIDFKFPFRYKWIRKNIWPWGAAFAVNKEQFIKAGRFDENIFLCNEEPDLLKRIPDRDVFISNRHIIHLEGHGTVVSVNRYYHALKSFHYYQEKHLMSDANRLLWNLHIKVLCVFLSLFARDENSKNYIKACELIYSEGK